jgi:hypothetical protein
MTVITFYGVALVTVLASMASAQRAVWIVDPANGPGSQFTSVQAAADSPLVNPGDVLQLQAGSHGRLQTSKPLVLLGTEQSLLAHVYVSSLPAGSEFVIHGVRVVEPMSPDLAMIEAWACPGRIVVSGIAYYASSVPQDALQRLVAAGDCADLEITAIAPAGLAVLLARCNATLRECHFYEHNGNPGISGLDAVVTHQSDVEMVDCLVHGSAGGLSTGCGMRVEDGTVRVRTTGAGRATVIAGQNIGGGIAPALQMTRTTVEIDPLVSIGAVTNLGGTFTVRSMPAMSTAVVSGVASATLFADTGTAAIVGFGFARAPVTYTAGADLRVDLRFGMACPVVGVLSASRMLTTMTNLPSGVAFLGAPFVAQGATLTAAPYELSNAGALIIR